jgi:hypothetical protein
MLGRFLPLAATIGRVALEQFVPIRIANSHSRNLPRSQSIIPYLFRKWKPPLKTRGRFLQVCPLSKNLKR